MNRGKKMNNRYKDFNKSWLIENNVHIFLDGVDTFGIDTPLLNVAYKKLEVYQLMKGKLVFRPLFSNTKPHPKGILKECTYYQVGISCGERGNRKTVGIPIHRVVYCWFNDIIKAYNDEGQKMEICHNQKFEDIQENNHITNLRWDTAKANRAERGGATNQYGKLRKKK